MLIAGSCICATAFALQRGHLLTSLAIDIRPARTMVGLARQVVTAAPWQQAPGPPSATICGSLPAGPRYELSSSPPCGLLKLFLSRSMNRRGVALTVGDVDADILHHALVLMTEDVAEQHMLSDIAQRWTANIRTSLVFLVVSFTTCWEPRLAEDSKWAPADRGASCTRLFARLSPPRPGPRAARPGRSPCRCRPKRPRT